VIECITHRWGKQALIPIAAKALRCVMMHVSLSMQVVEWTPQNDLLGDGRVKAFVTHGGLNSIYEVC